MIDEILEFILKIPAMLEFVVGAIVYLIVHAIASQVVAGVAEETVCKTSGIESSFLCFILTNEVVAFFSIVGLVVAIGLTFRYTFFR